LTQRRVAVVETAAGVHRELGQAGWRWLNPRLAAAYEKANDSSMVIQIQCAGRRILLCGDIQSDAMNDLLFDIESIRADIVELPHHGSHHDVAEAFIDRVHPSVVMQSTGWSRWSRDRWAKSLSSTQRLVTARDGACWVEIDVAGTIQTGRFLKWPNVAAGAE
jgi:beta-lactamase superfamily II metal-dependent hydrolase